MEVKEIILPVHVEEYDREPETDWLAVILGVMVGAGIGFVMGAYGTALQRGLWG